jgi:hypothetical protein
MKLLTATILATLFAGGALLADAATEIAGNAAQAPADQAIAPDSAR